MAVRLFILSAKRQSASQVDFAASSAMVALTERQYAAVCDTLINEAKDRWPEQDGWTGHKYDDAGELKRGYLLELADSANR